MTREIKFSYIQQHDETGRFVDSKMTLDEIEALITDIVYRRYTLVARRQFTGLRDKNGKEIYEGDVVRFNVVKGRDNEPAVNHQKGAVRMEPLSLAFGVWDATYCSQATIIGNIYENPELMEAQP
jgi:uncharacterized phage protein (TIGR01671 family)